MGTWTAMGTCMLAIIPGPIFALVDCVLELCFPMPLINVMLPNAIYRILDKTRTVYVIWKYIVAKCRNSFGEICPYSFRQRCRLNASATKTRGIRAGWSRCPSSFWPGECIQQSVALYIGWGFADICWVDGTLWSTMTHTIVREVSTR